MKRKQNKHTTWFILALLLFVVFVLWSGFYGLLFGLVLWPVAVMWRLYVPARVKKIVRSYWISLPAMVIGIIGFAVFLRVFVFEIYGIPSSSMENTLYPGDKVWVNKLHYGPRMPRTPVEIPWFNSLFIINRSWWEKAKRVSWPYKRLRGMDEVERNDVLVFDPPWGNDAFIKRCAACPGDRVEIRGTEVWINGKKLPGLAQIKYPYAVFYKDEDSLKQWADQKGLWIRDYAWQSVGNLAQISMDYMDYQHLIRKSFVDSISLFTKQNPALRQFFESQRTDDQIVYRDTSRNDPEKMLFPKDLKKQWSLHHYGPLKIPEKGMHIRLTEKNYRIYKDVIRQFEQDTIVKDPSGIKINGNYTDKYTFSKDYYFMLGDNRDQSNDSRYWGFVPEENIIGKATFLLFSSRINRLKEGRIFRVIR